MISDIFKKSFWTVLASLAFAVQSFIANKLFSLVFGPSGVTFLAHFQNLIALYTTPITDGANRGIQKFLSDRSASQEHWNVYISAALWVYGLVFFAITLFLSVLFLCGGSGLPSGFFSYVDYLLILVSVVLHFSVLFVVNMYLTQQNAKWFAWLSVLNHVFSLGLLFVSTHFELPKALIWVSFAPAGAVWILLPVYYLRNRSRWIYFKWSLQKKSVIQFLHFIFLSLSSMLFVRVVDFFVRGFAITHFSERETGFWQAIVKMSDGYSSVFLMAFGSLFFVRISSYLNHAAQLRNVLRLSVLYVSLLATLGLGLVWILRDWMIRIFYNPNFTEASVYLPFQLIGDWFKFPAWILSFVVLSRMHSFLYLGIHVFSAALYLSSIYLLLPYEGSFSMPEAHAIRNFGYLLLLLWVLRKDWA